MNCRERILKILDHEESDKVPYWEYLIQQPKLVKSLNLKSNKSKVTELDSEQRKLPAFNRKTLKKFGYDPIVVKPLLVDTKYNP